VTVTVKLMLPNVEEAAGELNLGQLVVVRVDPEVESRRVDLHARNGAGFGCNLGVDLVERDRYGDVVGVLAAICSTPTSFGRDTGGFGAPDAPV